MFVIAEHFLSDIVDEHDQYPVSTDGGTWYPHQACQFLKLEYHIHFFVYKNMRKVLLKEQCSI
jgi:hypothetical protein